MSYSIPSSVSEGQCPWCGLWHIGGGTCPRVKSLEYWPNGTIKRVEFHDEAPKIEPANYIVIDGELRRLVDEVPPGAIPLSPNAGLFRYIASGAL